MADKNLSQAIEKAESRAVARPLRVLVPLIQADLKQGREAAEQAGMPYYQAAGEKLIEAKEQVKHGEFTGWVTRNFNIKERQAREYMALAQHAQKRNGVATPFSTLSEFQRETGRRAPDYNTFASRKPEWQEAVRQVIDRVDTDTLNLKREELKRADEREAQRALALQLIDIGYKVLARTLHPDKKDGSREAMVRLNTVRERLKQHA